jgi:hypothetical protein
MADLIALTAEAMFAGSVSMELHPQRLRNHDTTNAFLTQTGKRQIQLSRHPFPQ